MLFPGDPGFAQFGGSVGGIAVHDGAVIFAENVGMIGSVYVCSSGVCARIAFEKLSPGPGMLGDVATDGTNVYWTSTADDSVHFCPLGGCEGGAPGRAAYNVLAAHEVNAGFPWQLAVGGSMVDFGQGGDAGPSDVWLRTPSACACTFSCSLQVSSEGAPTAIAADTAGAYWTTAAGAVIASPLESHSTSVLARATNPGHIAVDSAGVVFFTAEQPAGVFACATAGCNGHPATVLSGEGTFGEVAVDFTRVYAVTGAMINEPVGLTAPVGTAIVWVAK